MAMSVGDSADDTPMSDINTTPLVDVMLVLLIIFLIAVPVAIHNVKVKLPQVRFDPTITKPENVSLSVKESGGACQVYWQQTQMTHDELLNRAVEKLKADVKRLGADITAEDLPEVHIRGDAETPYHCVGGVIFTMQQAGFQKVGFISSPPPGEMLDRL